MPLFSGTDLPLEGIRIADLTHVWAGPKCTQVLADLGAEVIKVEAPRRADPVRGVTALLGLERYPNRTRGTKPQNRSGYFNLTNRNKYGIALNLGDPRGVAIFKRIVAQSDAVIDNFSAGVTARLGLGYEDLRTVKEDIIVLSMSGFGTQGPDSGFVAWADTVEALGGLPAVTGYRDGPPMTNYQAPSDPFNGIFGAAAIMAALRHRRTTGRGQYIDFSQLETLITLSEDSLMDHAMNGRVRGPAGNDAPDMAPHGAYPCTGPDRWIAIAVENDAQWLALATAMGDPALARDARFATVTARLAHREELDAAVGAWTRTREADAIALQLQDAGIPSGPVLDSAQVTGDPHLRARGVLQEIPHAEVGPYRYYIGSTARIADRTLTVRKPAPLFGEDTHRVLSELLGMSEDELASLERDEVISSELLQAVYTP